MLRDVYADDNCWVFAVYLSDNLAQFLDTGFVELRREPQGAFFYFFYLPFRALENPYVIWHSFALALQIATPIALLKLVRNLSDDPWLAAFVATASIVIPLDHVVPYLSAINHRVGLLLCVVSLYFTDVAAREGRWGWRATAALVLAAIAQHVLVEAAVGLEPARFLILWRRLHARGQSLAATTLSSIRWVWPFALSAGALVTYKMLFKPYGIYAGMYATSFGHLTDLAALGDMYRMFALGLWRALAYHVDYGESATALLGVAAAAVVAASLWRLGRDRVQAGQHLRAAIRSSLFLAILGAGVLLPMLFIFFYGGRPPRLGTDSTHGTLMQPGFALLIGVGAYLFARGTLYAGRLAFTLAGSGLALTCGIGVYCSNLNLDLFAEATRRQNELLAAFQRRFPTLPARTDFVIDAEPKPYSLWLPTFFHFEDMHANYELEFALHRLYAQAKHRGPRVYRVYPLEELMSDYRTRGAALFRNTVARKTHFGTDTLSFDQMTFVYYRGEDGRVLVNEEIAAAKPWVVYRGPAGKPPPAWAAPAQKR